MELLNVRGILLVDKRWRSGCFMASAILLAMTLEPRPASSAVPAGTWMFANRVALQIFDCRGLLCGKIVWLSIPDDPAGQPDLDHRNPDPALRQRHFAVSQSSGDCGPLGRIIGPMV